MYEIFCILQVTGAGYHHKIHVAKGAKTDNSMAYTFSQNITEAGTLKRLNELTVFFAKILLDILCYAKGISFSDNNDEKIGESLRVRCHIETKIF